MFLCSVKRWDCRLFAIAGDIFLQDVKVILMPFIKFEYQAD